MLDLEREVLGGVKDVLQHGLSSLAEWARKRGQAAHLDYPSLLRSVHATWNQTFGEA